MQVVYAKMVFFTLFTYCSDKPVHDEAMRKKHTLDGISIVRRQNEQLGIVSIEFIADLQIDDRNAHFIRTIY